MRFYSSLLTLSTLAGLLSCSGSNGPSGAARTAARISIDSVSCLNGSATELAVRIGQLDSEDGLDSISSFHLRISYNDTMLTFLGAELGEADSAWEYFTWRTRAAPHPYSYAAQVQLVAVRDLDNGQPPRNNQERPEGALARLSFVATPNRAVIGIETEVSFWSSDCGDNVLVDALDSEHYHMANSFKQNDSSVPTFDTMSCERRYTLSPDIEFTAGAVKMQPPPDDTGVVIINP